MLEHYPILPWLEKRRGWCDDVENCTKHRISHRRVEEEYVLNGRCIALYVPCWVQVHAYAEAFRKCWEAECNGAHWLRLSGSTLRANIDVMGHLRSKEAADAATFDVQSLKT
jgi:hypothetical protein